MSTSERRKHPRVAVNSELAPLDDGQFSYLANLSQGGALLYTPSRFSERAEIRLNCSIILDDVLPFSARARVVRIDTENHALGLEFLEPTPEMRALIGRVHEFQETRHLLRNGDRTAVAQWQAFEEPPRVRPLFDEAALKGLSSPRPASVHSTSTSQSSAHASPAPISPIERLPTQYPLANEQRETLESIPAVAAIAPTAAAAPALATPTSGHESSPRPAKHLEVSASTPDAPERTRGEEEVTHVFYYAAADQSVASQSRKIYDDLQDADEVEYERERRLRSQNSRSEQLPSPPAAASSLTNGRRDSRKEGSGSGSLPLPRPEDDFI